MKLALKEYAPKDFKGFLEDIRYIETTLIREASGERYWKSHRALMRLQSLVIHTAVEAGYRPEDKNGLLG